MITITAIIETKKGHEETMKMALMEVAAHVKLNEPETLNFFICQDLNEPNIFTSYERFSSVEAMEKHNKSEIVGHFFKIAEPILANDIRIQTCEELFTK